MVLGALQTIQTEHRNYACVLECLEVFLSGPVSTDRAGEDQLLFLMLDYLEAFPATFHHPKEDQYLFTAVRRRHPSAGRLLERLQDEHVRVLDLLADLRAACYAYREDRSVRSALREAGIRYHNFEQAHIDCEETELLPLALRVLRADDWREIHAAFARNDDPLFGPPRAEQFDRLYHWIVKTTRDSGQNSGNPAARAPVLERL